ncbi:MAG: acyl-CoA thioesterase [Anaerolineales bacterium]|nr:acyl-CoA thioesterase [Anaerolineales bacterium]
MGPVYTRAFKVRYTEMDAYGHVNNAAYLRYMQEAAFEASSASGLPLARWAELGRAWFIRDTEIEYLRPLTYPETFTLDTWLSARGQAWVRREYDFKRDGETFARAYSIWALVDLKTGGPAVADAVALAPLGGIDAIPLGPRPRFAEPPPPPAQPFTMTRRVDFRDMDAARHVNNASYISYIGECAWEVTAHFGWPGERMHAAGFAVFARRHRISYIQPAYHGDVLAVTTYGFDLKRVMATRHFRIERVNGDERALIARANSLYVWVDLATGQPIRAPGDYMEALGPNLAA